MIIDNAISHSIVLDDAIRKKLNFYRPHLRRFMFDEDASHKVGRMSFENIDTICRNTRYAIPPFSNTYIEIDNLAYFRGTGQVPDSDAAERIGFMWTNEGVCYIVAGDDHLAEFNPFTYVPMDSPEPIKLENYCASMMPPEVKVPPDRVDMGHPDFRRLLMVGGLPEEFREASKTFVPYMTSLWDVGLITTRIPPELLEVMFFECAGSFKRAITALLLLDERSKRRLVEIAARQKVVMGKLKAVARHQLVTIDLDLPSIRKMYSGLPMSHHETPIEHEVREHWMHFDVATQCTHDWQPYISVSAEEYDLNTPPFKPLRREICSLCGGRRTRKRSYLAGDPSKGSNVGKTKYKVIASKELWKGATPMIRSKLTLAAMLLSTVAGQACEIVTDGTLRVYRHELAHCNGWVHEPFALDLMPPAKLIHEYDGRLTVYLTGHDYGAQMATMSFAQYDAEFIPMWDETVVSLCQMLWQENDITVEATDTQWDQLTGCAIPD